jgi:predicted RNA binding protein YcfA (HicA-like mRNA interferase family)
MSPRAIPPMPGSSVIKGLGNLGFAVVRQSGSHVRLRHADGRAATVPDHGRRDLAIGTVHGILRQAKVSVAEFLAALS